ncbi:hypothetical protein AN958_04729 [Leucoagaricus sp. SymC.cos]|nr:hypothetical protein AN958_04729 [Leucoagaricus sp. SymC.cos]
MIFNGGIFALVQEKAKQTNVRIVTITRRNYRGSTPFTEAELRVINSGTDEEKTAFMTRRGVEILVFIYKFLVENKIPLQVPEDGIPGGVAIAGWSLGVAEVLAAIASITSADPDIQAHLAPLIHTLIIHEPSQNIIGQPLAPGHWSPFHLIDQTIPESAEMSFFVWWVTAYFQHGDLSLQSYDELAFHVPGFSLRPPTIYSIASAGRLDDIVESGAPSKVDLTFQINFGAQLLANYNAIYSNEIRVLFSNMMVFFMSGEHSPAYGPSTTWVVEDRAREHKGGFIKTKMLKGANHFCMWENPAMTLKAYLDCITRKI